MNTIIIPKNDVKYLSQHVHRMTISMFIGLVTAQNSLGTLLS